MLCVKLKSGFVYALCLLLTSSTLPAQAAPRPPTSDVEIKTASPDEGGSFGDPLVEARPLEGASLEMAVARATSSDAFMKARGELTAGRDLHQDLALALAFAGKYGPDGKEIEVVVIPCPDAKRPEEKAGFVAVARTGSRAVASFCIIERAVTPSEPGAVSLEVPVQGAPGEKAWLWTPEQTIGSSDLNKARRYFKCVTRSTMLGCAMCVTRCVVSVMFFVECMKYCCSAAFAFAVISCAVEMMIE